VKGEVGGFDLATMSSAADRPTEVTELTEENHLPTKQRISSIKPLNMGPISSNCSSSLSLSDNEMGNLEQEMEALRLQSTVDGEDKQCSDSAASKESRQTIRQELLRKSSSHLLVTANSSIDHLLFIRESNNNSRGGKSAAEVPRQKPNSGNTKRRSASKAKLNDHGDQRPRDNQNNKGRSPVKGENRNQNGLNQDSTKQAQQVGLPQTVPSKVDIQWVADNIKIIGISTFIEPKVTEIDESSNVVIKYQSPSFHTSANVSFPQLPNYDSWKVGWLQACSSMRFINVYGRLGLTSWEFPQLNAEEQTMVSDSDGKHFPWYGDHQEIHMINGPTTKSTTFKVKMNDSFYPQVTWMPPIAVSPRDVEQAGGSKKCMLTKIQRDQTFYTWLIARNERTKELIVLLTVTWRAQIDISIDPHAPRGRRASLFGVKTQQEPQILSHNVPIPRCAMEPPHANGAQMLMWRPFNITSGEKEEAEVIIAPRWKSSSAPSVKQLRCPKTIDINEEVKSVLNMTDVPRMSSRVNDH